MAVLRRTPRTVYRVYSEHAYLAADDTLTDWRMPRAPEPPRGQRLRGLVGVTGLIVAVGVAGALIAVTIMPARSPEGERGIAPSNASSSQARPDLVVAGTSSRRSRAALADDAGQTARVTAARLLPVSRSRGVRRHVIVRTAVSMASSRWATGSSTSYPWRKSTVSGYPQPVTASVTGRAEGEAGDVAMTSPTQSEFGFER